MRTSSQIIKKFLTSSLALLGMALAFVLCCNSALSQNSGPQNLLGIGSGSPIGYIAKNSNVPSYIANAPELEGVVGDRSKMEKYIAANPSSPYAAWLNNSLASTYRSSGRITLALNDWELVWNQLKNSTDTNQELEADHALAGQAELLTMLGRVNELHDLLTQAEGRNLSDPADRQRIEEAREGYSMMVRNPELNFRCGTLALAEIARMEGKPSSTIAALIQEPSPKEGISLLRLVQLSRQYDLGLVPVKRTDTTILPTPCIVHWAQNHYGALLEYRADLGSYRAIFGNPNWIASPDVDAESSGYFLIPEDKRPPNWPVISDSECAGVLGRSFIYTMPDSKDCGCKVQPTAPKAKCPTCPTAKTHGMPAWWVTEPYLNVWLSDQPVSYVTSRGEDFAFQITIKQRDSVNVVAYPRPGLLHNWYSRIFIQGMPLSVAEYTTNATTHQVTTNYVSVAVTNSFASWTATLDLPTGGQVTYNSSSNWSSSFDEESGTTLAPAYGALNDGTQYPVPGYPLGATDVSPLWTNTPPPGTSSEYGFTYWNDGASGFRVFHPDGSIDRYGLTYWGTLNSSYVEEALLTQHTDPLGNTVNLYYQEYTNSSSDVYLRLTQVIDYDGKTNKFVYFSSSSGLLEQIVTPYNQTATFAYDSQGNLTNITDAVTNSSGFSWNTNGWVTALNTPYGKTSFNYYDADLPSTNDSTLNGDIPVDRSVAVVDPNNGTNIYAYCFNSENAGTPSQFSSGVIPASTPLGTLDIGTNEVSHDYAAVSFRNSFYWDARQSSFLSTAVVSNMTSGDFLKARMQHWLGDPNNVMQSDLLSAEQDPSPDGTTPGQVTFYDYYGKTLPYLQGTNSQVAVVATVLPSGQTQYDWRQYNSADYVTKDISTYSGPSGGVATRTNTFIYGTNTITFVISNAIAGYPVVSPKPFYLNFGAYTESYDDGDGLDDVPTPVSPLFDVTLGSSSNNCGAWTAFIACSSTIAYPNLLVGSIDATGATNLYGAYSTVTTTTLAQNYIAWYNASEPNWDELNTESYNWPQYIIETRTVPIWTKATNALGYITSQAFNANSEITSRTSPSGLTTTYSYNSSGYLTNVTDVQIERTNVYTYTNGLVRTWQDELGLTTTFTYDNLNRLTSESDQQGYISNIYTKLDLTSSRDKIGNWSHFNYDPLERVVDATNANGDVTTYDWCDCGSLVGILDALTNLTSFNYDIQGRLTNVVYPDFSSVTYHLNIAGEITNSVDGAGKSVGMTYNNQNLPTGVYGVNGQESSVLYDIKDRPIQVTDANGVTVTNVYNALDELIRRTWPDGKSETYGYNSTGLISYTNRDGQITKYGRDVAGRMTAITNANNEILKLSYNPSSELISFVDGLNHTTSWQYNQSGWMTNKVDGLSRNSFQMGYNANGWLTSRWTPEKGSTSYGYDNVGNLASVTYPSSAISYYYDADNELTGMVDSVGTTVFAYTPAGHLAAENGPWPSDTVNYTYTQGIRTELSLSEPSGSWSQYYYYDALNRLTNTISPAGSFVYNYNFQPFSPLFSGIQLPNGAAIANNYNTLAQLTQTVLTNHWGHDLDGYSYSLDPLGLITNILRNFGLTSSSVRLGYDNIGQLTSWLASETNGTSRLNEQFGFGFDSGDNLHFRTNNALSQTFTVDSANELSSVARNGTFTLAGAMPAPVTNLTVNGTQAQIYGDFTFASAGISLASVTNIFSVAAQNIYGVVTNGSVTMILPSTVTLAYDNNGNLTNDGTRSFLYNSENQLTNVFVPNSWRADFVYDGLGRRRIVREYGWTGSWTETNEIHYIYDGKVPIQDRDVNNNVLVTYTRGLDMSGSFQGGGGIGGLLARTDGNGSTFYHSDVSGNVTALMDSQENVVARYLYGPFGKLTGAWGSLATANEMEFSSMPYYGSMGLSGFLDRFYEPNLQRWLNQDPIQESGDVNLYSYVDNNSIGNIDPLGLQIPSPANVAMGWSDASSDNPAQWDAQFQSANVQATVDEASVAAAAGTSLAVAAAAPESLGVAGSYAWNALAAGAGGYVGNGVNNSLTGQPFNKNAGTAAATGAALGVAGKALSDAAALASASKAAPKIPCPNMVDPSNLKLPPTRSDGADPFKLASQMKQFGNSVEGMPPVQVTQGANGDMMINDGVTRATLAAMNQNQVPVEVIENNPSLDLSSLPTVGQRISGK